MPATQTLLPVIGIAISYERAKSLPITSFNIQLNLGDVALNSTVGGNYVVGYRIQSAAGKVVKEYDSSELSIDKSRINFQFTDSCGYQDLLSSQYGDDANFMGPYKISFIEILDKSQVSYDSANFSLSGTTPLIYKTYTLPYIINDGSYVTDLPPTTTLSRGLRRPLSPLYSWNNVKQLTIDGQARNSIYSEIHLSYEFSAISQFDLLFFYDFAVGVPTGNPGQWGLPGFTPPYAPYMYNGTRTTSLTPGEIYTSDYLKIPSLSIGSDYFSDPTVNYVSSSLVHTSGSTTAVPYTNKTVYTFNSSGVDSTGSDPSKKNMVSPSGFTIPKNWAGYLTFKLIGGGNGSSGEVVSTPPGYKGIVVHEGDLIKVDYNNSNTGSDTVIYLFKAGPSGYNTPITYRAHAGGYTLGTDGFTPVGEKLPDIIYSTGVRDDRVVYHLQPDVNFLGRDYTYGVDYKYGRDQLDDGRPFTFENGFPYRVLLKNVGYTRYSQPLDLEDYRANIGYYLITLTPDTTLAKQVITPEIFAWTRDPSINTFTAPSPNSLTKPAGAQWLTLPYIPLVDNIFKLDLRFLLANVDVDKSYFYSRNINYATSQQSNTLAPWNPVLSSHSFKFKPLYSNFTASIGSVLTNTYTNTSGGIYYTYYGNIPSSNPETLQAIAVSDVTAEKTLIVGNNPYNMLYSQFPVSFDLLAMGGFNTEEIERDSVPKYVSVRAMSNSSSTYVIIPSRVLKETKISYTGATTGEQLTSTSASNILVSPGDIIKYSIGNPSSRENSYIKVIRNGNLIYNYVAHSGATCSNAGNDITNWYRETPPSFEYLYSEPEKSAQRPTPIFINASPTTTNTIPGIKYVSGVTTTTTTPQQGKLKFSIDYSIPKTINLPPTTPITYNIYESIVAQKTTFTIPKYLSDGMNAPSKLKYRLIGGGGPSNYYTWRSKKMSLTSTESSGVTSDAPYGGGGGEYCQGTISILPGDEVTIVAGKGGYYEFIETPGVNNSSDKSLVGVASIPYTGSQNYTAVYQRFGEDSYLKVYSPTNKYTSIVVARGGIIQYGASNRDITAIYAIDGKNIIDVSANAGNNRVIGGNASLNNGAVTSLPSGFIPTTNILTYGCGGSNQGVTNLNSKFSSVTVSNNKLMSDYVKDLGGDMIGLRRSPDTIPGYVTYIFNTVLGITPGGNGYYQLEIN